MSFPRYPKYKDSGVEWLGEVPEHWEVSPSKCLTSFTTGWTPPSGNDDLYGGVHPWANISDLGPRTLTETAKTLADHAIESGRIAKTPKGALLFSFKLSIGQVSFAGMDMYTNEAIASFLPSKRLDLAYAYYMLPIALAMNATENIYGAKLLNQELIRNAKALAPPTSDQAAIATFLDRETAKIDALIAEQQRLIELLQEKRQAVISHAVTKGLNPDAPMKDSGIEWLGEVPEHWTVCRVKAVSSFTTSGPRGWSERVGDEGALFVQSGDLTDVMGVDFANCSRVQVGDDAETARTQLRGGDVVVCVTGAKTGNIAVCETVPEASYVNQHVCLVRPNERVHPRFLATLLKSGYGQTYFSLAQYGLKQGLSLENVREAPVVLPPLDEQRTIIEMTEDLGSRCLLLQGEAQRTITLLQERRSALISAAVTGQIDVRGFSFGGTDAA